MSETIPYVTVADMYEAPGVPAEVPTMHVPFSMKKVAKSVRSMRFVIASTAPTSHPQMHALVCELEDGTQFRLEPRKFRELARGDMIEVAAVLSVSTPEVGARLAKKFAESFEVPLPVAGGPGTPQPIAVSLIRTGSNVTRFDNGSFSRRPGGWTSTKMTLDDRGLEVFFNFNLAARVGEFSEKRASHDPGIADLLMRVLHDGQPPQVPVEQALPAQAAPPPQATSSTELTPYLLARTLRQNHASDAAIALALRARGLDAEEVGVLLNAVR